MFALQGSFYEVLFGQQGYRNHPQSPSKIRSKVLQIWQCRQWWTPGQQDLRTQHIHQALWAPYVRINNLSSTCCPGNHGSLLHIFVIVNSIVMYFFAYCFVLFELKQYCFLTRYFKTILYVFNFIVLYCLSYCFS